ncbi:hypothetical protein J5N97_000403 [Dioscorea zingiberensis]|uniref:SUMO-activating enzyme subunit n=1 Tax=Dioscorea zingiberensis TaxID=325984 RepID=A0A9D5H1E4_9LILI|nr:hypothetical protein J5N97_000403 [Dioscorea zingiberensis]
MATQKHSPAIKGAKVLMVGAGGIGCELLKTLALSGFQDIHIIDMDTIEVSNLNRQFLFRQSHVGQSKAKVSCFRDAVLKFRPHISITPYHANVKDPDFNVDFFKQFNVVLNGLDNLDARRHVNRLCLAADVPLIESGTTGFLGQFVHCIVWAKELLFAKLFGDKNQANDLNVRSSDGASSSEQAEDVFEHRKDEDIEQYGRRIYDHVFGYNIEEIGNMIFDKDDQLAVEFVTAAANIRATAFGIPLHSLFEAKDTTIIRDQHQPCKIRDIVEKIVKNKLGMNSPLIMHGAALLYEVGDDLDEAMIKNYAANLDKVLSEFPSPVTSGTMLTIEDLQQELKCNINIKHREEFDEEKEPDGMVLSGWTQATSVVKDDKKSNANVGSTSSASELETDKNNEIETAPGRKETVRCF